MPHHAGSRRGNDELDQHHYVKTVASKFNVEKTSTSPAAARAKLLSKDDVPQTKAETEKFVSLHLGRR